jgi:hypothetical protein
LAGVVAQRKTLVAKPEKRVMTVEAPKPKPIYHLNNVKEAFRSNANRAIVFPTEAYQNKS